MQTKLNPTNIDMIPPTVPSTTSHVETILRRYLIEPPLSSVSAKLTPEDMI